jgi:Leucine-rich repeat (LRR) protein
MSHEMFQYGSTFGANSSEFGDDVDMTASTAPRSPSPADTRPFSQPQSLYLSNLALQQVARTLFAGRPSMGSMGAHNHGGGFLRSLYLDHNRLSNLDFLDAPALASLQLLNVRFNELRSLPDSLGRLTQLQFLYVDHNKLTRLPHTIQQLRELQMLSASNNRLAELPEELGECVQLQTLQVSHNKLRSLPTLTRCEELSHVYLEDNLQLRLTKGVLPLTLVYLSLDMTHATVGTGTGSIGGAGVSSSSTTTTTTSTSTDGVGGSGTSNGANIDVLQLSGSERIREFLASVSLCVVCHRRQRNASCSNSACKSCCVTRSASCSAHGTSKASSSKHEATVVVPSKRTRSSIVDTVEDAELVPVTPTPPLTSKKRRKGKYRKKESEKESEKK